MTSTTWKLKTFSSAFNPNQTELFGDKVVLPQKILNDISEESLQNFHFIIKSQTDNEICCTALEYSYDTEHENNIYMPDWMFQNLYLELHDEITLTLLPSSPKKCEKIIVQPHDSIFITLPDHKGLLESNLLNFNVLTNNTTITIDYNSMQYSLTINKIFPENEKYVSLIDTDVEVDFMSPLDYVEQKPDDWPSTEAWPLPNGVTIREEILTTPKKYVLSNNKEIIITPPPPPKPNIEFKNSNNMPNKVIPNKVNSDTKESPPKFIPFSGKGHRLGN